LAKTSKLLLWDLPRIAESPESLMKYVRYISGAFTGGALGGLLDSFNIWFMGKVGLSDLIGISMKPDFTAPWLYQRMIWGGLWMLLLLIPVWKDRTILRGMVASIFPSAMVLLVVFPSMNKGVLGLEFGIAMPMVVITLNFIYGIFSAYWYVATCSNENHK